MKCPTCHSDSREGAVFCRACGHPLSLERVCPQCAHPNLPDSRFCEACGQDLKGPPTPPLDYSHPNSYTPRFLAEKILTTRSSVEGERKLVTVLFADVANFTSISEKLDPEEIHGIMDGCFKILMDEIHKYEGTINQFTGDGVMALFGAPLAHEDHAVRACYASLSIQHALARYGEKLKADCDIDFRMRIGLNSGPVVVGAIGDDLRMDYTAIGDTINLASRMESSAPAGAIYVSGHTHRLARDFFTFSSLDKVQVKGKEEPQEAYVLLSPTEVKTRIEASAASGLTPFVGRHKEMETLSEALGKARSGTGQVVGIVGEAGVGKSRIILEMRHTFPEYTYLEGRCLHYGGSMAYLPLLDILRSYFGIKEGEREFLVKKKIREKVSLDLPPLYELLSLTGDDEAYLALEPRQKRERIFEALRDLFVGESGKTPLVLIIEDLHWIDKTSEEFLDYLIGWLATTPILLILLYRPEYVHRWASKSSYTNIRVDQLALSTSAELVQSILSEGDIVPELRDLILTKAAGNPLFMEELTHTLLENGTIEKRENRYHLSRRPSEIQVPDTVQGIIAARMDRLDESLKRIMHVASVIGREFAFRILQSITEMKEDLKGHLLNLQGLEFIYEKRLFPELEYIFKHALTQEVAYNSLLLARRKEIHGRIGKAIEEIYPDRLEEFYEMLAYHYAKSEALDKAYHYLKLSGDKAVRSSANQEALQHYKDAIALLKGKPETTENKRELLNLILRLGVPMEYLVYPEDPVPLYEEGQRLCKEFDDKKGIAILSSFFALFYILKGDLVLAKKYQDDAYREAEEIEDVEILARVAPGLCASYMAGGNLSEAARIASVLMTLLEKTHREREFFGLPLNPYVGVQSMYAVSMGDLGRFEEGERVAEQALSLARGIDHSYTIGFAELEYGAVFVVKGDGENAVAHLRNAVEYFERSKADTLLPTAWGFFGHGYYLLGKLDTALESLEKALKIQANLGLSFLSSFCHAKLSQVHFDLGNLSEARLHADEALSLAQRNREGLIEPESWICLGRVIGKTDRAQIDKAEEYMLRGMKMSDELGMKPYYASGHLALGELYADGGQREKAREHLKKAEAMYEEMGMDYWLVRTKRLLESLETEAP
ncbi:MAG: adenylate/guanylate cyclase domain-containing protein [Syntrophorhabdales bacterium]